MQLEIADKIVTPITLYVRLNVR